jgi:hypothetical protein
MMASAADPPTPALGTPPPEPAKPGPGDGGGGWSDRIRAIGGLVAVVAGVIAVLGIAIGAFVVDTQTAATVAGATAGVVGSIVGAYFGVKVGTDQSRTALDHAEKTSQQKDEEHAKALVYALNMPPEKAPVVEQQVRTAVTELRQARG